MGVPEALLAAVARNPRSDERDRVAQLLRLWDTKALTALGGGGWNRFSHLPLARRERVLRSWSESRLGQRRAAYEALRKGALLMYYTLPAPAGGPNPLWERMDYPGPLGVTTDAAPPLLHPERPVKDAVLDCDVCVVGSGAGGGTAAAVLATAGFDVIVLEAGDHYEPADFDGAELSGYTRMYLEGGAAATRDQSVGLLAGWCVGGGTVINYTTSFPTPDDVRAEWAAAGVTAFAGAQYTQSLDAVCERLSVNTQHSRPPSREQVMHRGLEALGWHVASIPRNVVGCDQGRVCGYCGYGCRLGAKQSTARTWLVDAESHGARIVAGASARRVLVEAGRARGVEATTREGHRVTVRSRAVMVACGAIHTPALLRRSGLHNEQIGRNLHLHPATPLWGLFDEEVRPWTGTMQALYSDEHRFLDGGYGVKYETAPVHPSLLAAFAPWTGAARHAAVMRDIGHLSPVGVLLRDRDGGEVRVGRDGEPRVRYHLSAYDTGHLRRGIEGAARILEAAGAKRIFSSQASWVAYEPGSDGDLRRFMSDADRCGYAPARVGLFSFHIMGTARMGGSASTSACRPDGETWEVKNLHVCDASTFPSASGVNPMVSIEAISHMTAKGLAASLRS